MLERSISLFCTGGSVFPTQLPPWCAIMKMNLTEISYYCHVKVDIYFTGVGMIDIPTEQEILTLMEEIRSESDSLQTD